MYNLSLGQKDYITNFLDMLFDNPLDDPSLTAEQAQEKLNKLLGNDTPFEFEGQLIVNPLYTPDGKYLFGYNRASEYYGEENVNRYFGKLWNHKMEISGQSERKIKEDSDTFLEELKSIDDPIYIDDKFKIYHYSNPADMYSNTDIGNLDVDINKYSDGDLYLICSRDYADDDFVDDDNAVIVIDMSDDFAVYVRSNDLSGDATYVSTVEDVRDYVKSKSEKAWDYIDKNILRKDMLTDVGLIYSDIIKDFSLKFSDLTKWLKNKGANAFDEDIIKDMLNDDYVPYDASYLYNYDLPEDLFDSISEANMRMICDKFNITRDQVKEAVTNSSDSDLLGVYNFLEHCYVESVQNCAYSNVLRDILNNIRACFPKTLYDHLDLDSGSFRIVNCPKEDYLSLLSEFIDQNEPSRYLSELYKCEPREIIGYFIYEYFSMTDNDNYEEFDPDEFNDVIETRIEDI